MIRNEKQQAELQALYDRHKALRASMVLAKAKSKKSSLHDLFEWDDTKAAHQHRLEQARRICRVVVIQHGDGVEKLVHVPVVKSEDADSAEGYYKPVSVMVQDEYDRAKGQALAALAAAERNVEILNRSKRATKRTAKALAGIQTATAMLRT